MAKKDTRSENLQWVRSGLHKMCFGGYGSAYQAQKTQDALHAKALDDYAGYCESLSGANGVIIEGEYEVIGQ